ncbi:2-amino-4-hydroxy-6-hydroxymethyldihydropteridine diphosphokinase [Acinetobacter defluvii]|uniref:2-amino-4-hydroxy-6- hydroxymethyldihydropteridine diphosphokinase n=1 Tax=Acinetobacter defluvii TaxID=1871111 RepID=UPI003AF5D4F9
MNDTATIFALALASNHQPKQHLKNAFAQIKALGEVTFSKIYLIPCRDHIGEDYCNAACLLRSHLSMLEMTALLKKMESDSGRVRPSHHISLDIDLIAWGQDLNHMYFNPKKLPLALDVKIPLYEIWQHEMLLHPRHAFPEVNCQY